MQQDYPQWIIFYTDGSTVTAHEFEAVANQPPAVINKVVPPFGVQVIAQLDYRVGYNVVLGGNFYWYEYGTEPGSLAGWVAGDWQGALQYILNNPRRAWVLWGQIAANADYAGIKNMVANDNRLPPKTGRLKNEV